jgi:NitT/TauT family transport system permease protein
MAGVQRALGAAAGLAGLGLCWSWAHRSLGPFVLPSPTEAALRLAALAGSGEAQAAALSTAVQALSGWLLACLSGFAAAGVAAAMRPVESAGRTLSTVLLGVPPVAWLVLALLWFGPNGAAPAFTVAVAIAPVIFLAALQGLEARDPLLDEMASLFGARPWQRATDIVAPQLLDHLLPAMATALGFAWKVCVMAEVMGSGTGIGGRLATARAHLDLPEAMAWILLVVGLVLGCDLLIVAPLRGWLRRSRAPVTPGAPLHA